MSYEGYTQNICEKGHLTTTEDLPWQSDDSVTCEICQSEIVFRNSVDDTNCDSVGVIPDHHLNRLLLSDDVTKVCDLGHTHVIEHRAYRVPTSTELREMQSYWDNSNQKYVPLEF